MPWATLPRVRRPLLPCATATLLLTAVLTAVLAGGAAQAGTALVVADRAAPGPGSAGIGDDYFPLDGNGGYDVAHYSIRDDYDQRTGRLSGTTILRATATADLSELNLDLLLPVRSVSVDGRRASFEKQGRHELVVTPRSPLAAGASFRVRVAYAGHPGNYSYAGESNWATTPTETVAVNQPHMAPWWFAANDHPLDKATFDIKITGAAADRVVSNGDLVRRRTTGPGLVTTHWRATEPMATYLAFFAMGDYAVRKGSTLGLRFYSAVSKDLPRRERRSAMRAMLRSPEIVRWLESVVGPYPFSSTGGVTTSVPLGFALENQTRPVYPVLVRGRIVTVVHELAHQWFGDSVAVSGWRDIWVNEGLATFFEQLWVESRGGSTAQSWLEHSYDRLADNAGFWQLQVDDPGPGHLFDAPVYLRGAMATQALRHRIGETAFSTLLRTWVGSRRGANGSSADFEALAAGVSGIDLTSFFDAWLRGPTPPARTADNGF